MVNNTAPLLMNELHALDSVLFVIAVQSATCEMLLSKVMAIKPTSTMTAILIIVFTSTIDYGVGKSNVIVWGLYIVNL